MHAGQVGSRDVEVARLPGTDGETNRIETASQLSYW
jgi:hypothetical protein